MSQSEAIQEPSAPSDALESALTLIACERAAEAVAPLERLHFADPLNARLRSFYGLGVALGERDFERGCELCRSALKQEFFNPELYLNLARVHLAFGFKAEAIRFLRRGQMIDPGDSAIRDVLSTLGARRAQVFRFLPRRHRLNRWVGRVRAQLERDESGAAARA